MLSRVRCAARGLEGGGANLIKIVGILGYDVQSAPQEFLHKPNASDELSRLPPRFPPRKFVPGPGVPSKVCSLCVIRLDGLRAILSSSKLFEILGEQAEQ